MQAAAHDGNSRMTKTYAQLKKQIETLSREADSLRQKERAGVITRIVEAIAVYELTAADLGLAGGTRGKPAAGKATRKVSAQSAAKPARKSSNGKARRSKAAGEAKFRDANGNVWGGRGPRPQWLRSALAEGKALQDFAVQA